MSGRERCVSMERIEFSNHIKRLFWIQGSLGDEREMSKTIASKQKGKEVLLVSEGQEKDEFWDAIGGKEEYSNDKRLQTPDDPHSARLFQCSNAKGRLTIEEIPSFDQSDLIEDDVMLLGKLLSINDLMFN